MLGVVGSTSSTQMPRTELRSRPPRDDELLGDVDETTGQVAGVGGPQRGVDQTLAGTVGGDEVLEHGQAFTEVAT